MGIELIIKVAIFHDIDNLEIFLAKITENNYQLARGKLEFEYRKIVEFLKQLKKEGEIKSIYRPKNKNYQKKLNKIVEVKKLIKESIQKLKIFYRNI